MRSVTINICFEIENIDMSGFDWKGGKLLVKKRMGCPSTPIQGQPNLHDN
jgi:hypothetical protein